MLERSSGSISTVCKRNCRHAWLFSMHCGEGRSEGSRKRAHFYIHGLSLSSFLKTQAAAAVTVTFSPKILCKELGSKRKFLSQGSDSAENRSFRTTDKNTTREQKTTKNVSNSKKGQLEETFRLSFFSSLITLKSFAVFFLRFWESRHLTYLDSFSLKI